MPYPSPKSPASPASASPFSKMSKPRASSANAKPKGAVRAKSGCYTCRIRRKKCDEKPDPEGNCQTCVRLRLQCLGFGAKRPDWMREGNNVVELREKIKNFLASQGMIKGHSGQPSPAHRDGSGSDQGDNEGSPGGPSSSSFAGAPNASSAAASAAAASSSALGSGPNGNHVLVLSQQHRNPPYTMGGANDRSISPANVNGAFPPGTGAGAGQQRYLHNNSSRRGGGAYGNSLGISTAGAGAGAAATGFGNGHGYGMDPHSPHSRRSPSASSLDEHVNLLGIENDPYSSRPASVIGYRSSLSVPSSFRHPISVVTSSTPCSTPATCLPSPSPSLAGSSPGANAFSRALPNTRIFPFTPAPEPHLDIGLAGPDADGYHYSSMDYGYFAPAGSHSQLAYARAAVHNHSPPFGLSQLSPDSPKQRNGILGNPLFGGQQQQQQHLGGHQGHLSSQHYGHVGGHYGASADGAVHPSSPCNGNRQEQLRHTHFNHTDPNEVLRFTLVQTYPDYPPSVQSTFGTLYHQAIMEEPDPIMSDVEMVDTRGNGVLISASHPYREEAQRQWCSAEYFMMPSLVDPSIGIPHEASILLRHYLSNVRPMQYFFAGAWIDKNIFELAQSHEIVRDSICLVASVHRRRWNERDSPSRAPLALPEGDDAGAKKYAHLVRDRLLRKFGQPRNANDIQLGDALAGLQCVSSFLFAGGIGDWDKFLNVARMWVEKILRPIPGANDGCAEALRRLDTLHQFIIKATMWFEVLASVTKIERPYFMDAYEELFEAPRVVAIEDQYNAPSELSMLDVMGCDDQTFLAIAKISALAAWKAEHSRHGTLDVMELVAKGMEIQAHHLQPLDDTFSMHRMPILEDTLGNRKQLTADIFRAAARLYLNTVLSGDKPTVRKISESVCETVGALGRIPNEPESLRQSVVRSVVFPICIAGCMTDDVEQRKTLLLLLEGTPGAGNCNAVAQVMKDVWAKRDPPPASMRRQQPRDVSWREALRENGALLLV